VNDFAASSKELEDSMISIIKAVACGKLVGIFHWAHYDSKPNQELNGEICRLIDAFAVTQISAYQTVRTNIMMLCDPSLLKHIIDGLPRFEFEKLVVLNEEHRAVRPDLDALFRQGWQN
jgi:hypothetical protein